MTRLIDLDDDRHCFTGNCGDYENWNIDPDIPTVDAIPIEWIKEYIRTHPASTDIYFKWMIDDWKKEQEKQND